jgi:AcrR family transcriptional regulator
MATTTGTGRRAENRRRTFESLRDSGLTLFAERGFDETTIEQIAERAGVSLRTFFRYFSCKEALLFGSDLQEQCETILRGRPEGESLLVSLHQAGVELWRTGAAAGEGRRALRRTLLRAHPSVRAYGRKLVMDTAPVMATIAAERLGVDPDDDLRPLAFAGLWTGLVIFLFEHEQPRGDGLAVADAWLAAAGTLFLDERTP